MRMTSSASCLVGGASTNLYVRWLRTLSPPYTLHSTKHAQPIPALPRLARVSARYRAYRLPLSLADL